MAMMVKVLEKPSEIKSFHNLTIKKPDAYELKSASSHLPFLQMFLKYNSQLNTLSWNSGVKVLKCLESIRLGKAINIRLPEFSRIDMTPHTPTW